MICIVDYGLGNIRAFCNMYKRMNGDVRVCSAPDDLTDVTKIILPGVGAFDHAMELLEASRMRPKLQELVLARKVPVLGVCVGMQILADGSDEGILPGLGWVRGRVRAFKALSPFSTLPVPHMGWNDVHVVRSSPMLKDLELGARFYFLHSFYFDADRADACAATATYGIDFSCAVQEENVFGVQFHPEKSHRSGAQLLKNFAEL
jgi:glutamine amidotransferase